MYKKCRNLCVRARAYLCACIKYLIKYTIFDDFILILLHTERQRKVDLYKKKLFIKKTECLFLLRVQQHMSYII